LVRRASDSTVQSIMSGGDSVQSTVVKSMLESSEVFALTSELMKYIGFDADVTYEMFGVLSL